MSDYKLGDIFYHILDKYNTDKTEIAKGAALIAKEYFENKFIDERWGANWKNLSPKYAQQKAKDGYGDQPKLVRTGTMRAEFFNLLELGVENANFEEGIQFYITELMDWHNSGAGNLPKRQFIGWPNVLLDKINKYITEELAKSMNK
jgi:hypothetical protein